MKMRLLSLFGAALLVSTAVCQWNTTGTETYLNPAQNGVNVGTSTSPASVLTVRGDEAATPTGEVFRTDAPTGSNTSWRLLRGGTNYGRVFNLSTDAHLRLDASAGDLRFLTNNLERGRFNQTLTGQTINGFPGLDLSGFLGVGNFTGQYQHAAARFHSENGTNLTLGYRPVMREGFLATRGEALYYGGVLDGVDSGILWSFLTGVSGSPGVFKFIYTGHNQTATVASSTPGLELGRFQPAATLNEGYFGVGDWTTASATPDERLDILDRTVKIRRLIPDYNDNSLDNVVVADAAGRLHWRDASTLSDCDWEVTGTDNVVTAYAAGPLAGCPDESNNVGIGTANPGAKLDILKVVNGGGATDIGVNVRMGTTSTNNYGGNADVYSGTGAFNMGWRGSAMNAARDWGLDGNAAMNNMVNTNTWNGARVVGVRGFADGNFLQPTNNIRGIWGIGLNPISGAWGYGGWFDGYAYCSLGIWGPSDASLKQNVEPLANAMDVIGQLQPMSYNYRWADYPTMALDDRLHYGLIAQDLENVLPALVQQSGQPAALDSLGNVTIPAVDFKAVNYEGLIPG